MYSKTTRTKVLTTNRVVSTGQKMVTRRRTMAATGLIFVVVVALAVAGIGAILLTSQPSSVGQTTSTTIGTPSTGNATSSVLSPNGLRLTLSMPDTAFSQGTGVPIDISLFNTLTTANNLTPMNGGTEFKLGPCTQLPLGVAIFEGNYAANNLSQGTPLGLFYPGIYSCPAMFDVDYWLFAPQSDNITLVSLQPTGTGNATAPRDMWTQEADANLEYWGYWSGQAEFYPSLNASFTSFPPGSYTVAASDAWGQLVILHFNIVPTTVLLTCTSIATNPSFVGYTNASSSSGPLSLQDCYREIGSNNTYLLALSATGNSPVSLTYLDYSGNWAMQFSANPSQIQTWQFYTPAGILAYPATFQPSQCSLLRVNLPYASQSMVLRLELSDNETQTFTLNS